MSPADTFGVGPSSVVMSQSQCQLAQAIEQYPCLYNYYSKEYANAVMKQTAWEQVAAETDMSVTDCKEKWKNMRSALRKRMRAPAISNLKSKPKRPYYLHGHLKFILPYLKPIVGDELANSLPPSTSSDSEPSNTLEGPYDDTDAPKDLTAVRVKQEFKSEEEDCYNSESYEESAFLAAEQGIIKAETDEVKMDLTAEFEDVQRPNCQTHETVLSPEDVVIHVKNKGCQTKFSANRECCSCHAEQKNMSPTMHFFMSLAPEFDTMTAEQVRELKMKVLGIIDEMKKT